MRFFDREDAGRQLAEKLIRFKNTDSVVLGIPRGGIPVAAVVAEKLVLPLDIVLVKKIGHPGNREYAVGAVGLTEEYIVSGENIRPDYLESEISNARIRLQEMQKKFKRDKPFLDLKGKNVIITDDGIATGKTLMATIRIIRKSNPGAIIVAVPVISTSALQSLRQEADEVISVNIPDYFTGVGAFYEHFGQVSDDEVSAIMQRFDKTGK